MDAHNLKTQTQHRNKEMEQCVQSGVGVLQLARRVPLKVAHI